MTGMSAMASVPEHVQQWTGEKEQERQIAEDVSAMLGQEKCSPNEQECEEDEAAARGPEAASRAVGLMRKIVVCHVSLLVRLIQRLIGDGYDHGESKDAPAGVLQRH
jgi:hypothetical protein